MEPNLNSSNHYEVLGVESDCEDRDIKIAYRRLAKLYHPDKNKSKEAQQIFVSVSRAYEILSSEEDRIYYNKILNSETEESYSFKYTGEDLSRDINHWANIFEDAFKKVTGEDVNVYCRLELEEFKSGCDKIITLNSGKISIKIKPDTKPGSILKVSGKGNATLECPTPGDLYINLVAKANSIFKLQESGDIIISKDVTYQDIVLGTTLVIKTLSTTVKIKIPELTPIDQEFRLKGLGLGGGDFILKLNLVIPSYITSSEKKAVSKLNSFTNLKLG
jgi:curved DNA-binding protein